MGVEPRDDFFSIGPYGGPFDPPSKTYTLANNGDFPIEFSAGADAAPSTARKAISPVAPRLS